MSTTQSASGPRAPQVGDVWRDLSAGYERLVWIERVNGESLQILSVHQVARKDGIEWVRNGKAGKRWTKLKRFSGPKPHFEFVVRP